MINLPDRVFDIFTKKYVSYLSEGITSQIPGICSGMHLGNLKEFVFDITWDFPRTEFRILQEVLSGIPLCFRAAWQSLEIR